MAIDELLDEHEQGERVRRWLRSNAPGLIGGVVLGLAAIGGWHWWQGRQQQAAMAVNARYAQAVAGFAAGRLPPDQGRAEIAAIAKGNPTLGALAALELAHAQVAAGKRDDAIATLRGLHDLDPALRALVRERLARLLVDAGKGREALAQLAQQDDAGAWAVRGDAYLALGERAQAREAYRKALGKLDVGDPQYRLVQFKLIDAGGQPPHAGEQS